LETLIFYESFEELLYWEKSINIIIHVEKKNISMIKAMFRHLVIEELFFNFLKIILEQLEELRLFI